MTLTQVLNRVVGAFVLLAVLLAALLIGLNLMNQPSTFKFLAGVVVIMVTLWLLPQIAARMFRRTNGKQGKLDSTSDDALAGNSGSK